MGTPCVTNWGMLTAQPSTPPRSSPDHSPGLKTMSQVAAISSVRITAMP